LKSPTGDYDTKESDIFFSYSLSSSVPKIKICERLNVRTFAYEGMHAIKRLQASMIDSPPRAE